MDAKERARSQPAYFSRQVKYVRSFYLDLAPPPDARSRSSRGVRALPPDYVIDRASFQYLGLEFVASGRIADPGRAGGDALPGLVFCYGPGVPHRIVADRQDPRASTSSTRRHRRHREAAECRLGPGALCHVVNPVDVQRVFDDLIHDGSRGGAMATRLCSSRSSTSCSASPPRSRRATRTTRRILHLHALPPPHRGPPRAAHAAAGDRPGVRGERGVPVPPVQRYDRQTPYSS